MAWPCIRGQLYMMQVTKVMLKTNFLKKSIWPHLETLKDIATKSDETHIRDSSNIMQIFKPIAARYLSPVRAKIYILFLTGDSPGWLPSHTIHFSKALIKLILSCNWHVMLLRLTIVEKFALLEGQNFGFWGSLGATIPREGEDVWDQYVPSCKISCRSVSPPPRYVSPYTKKSQHTIYMTKHILALHLSYNY